jgi:hypothetical protein
VVIIAKKEREKEPMTPIEHLYFDYIVPYSFPFNYVLFNHLQSKGRSHKDSMEATMYFGYLASWQKFYTVTRRLEKGGYFYRSREAIRNDTGLIRDAQKRARDILEAEGLIEVKPVTGQSNRLKIKVNPTSKYMNRAVIDYKTRHINTTRPDRITDTNYDLEFKGVVNEQGKCVDTKEQVSSVAIVFESYKQTELLSYATYTEKLTEESRDINEVINLIDYFILKHERAVGDIPGRWNRKLQASNWDRVFWDMMYCYDNTDELIFLEPSDVRNMIDHYFTKTYQQGCDYSIMHFNNDEIKKILFYDVCY